MTAHISRRYVLARDRNVLRVDFNREPDPPAPGFPGAGALRPWHCEDSDQIDSALPRVATATYGASIASTVLKSPSRLVGRAR